MKLKNVYKMGVVFSWFFAIFPLLWVIVANIIAYYSDCWFITEAVVPNCALWEVVYSIFVLTWVTLITLPLGLIFAFVFWLLYLSVRRR